MAKTNYKKPDMVQAFDFYVDREYYKKMRGFLFSYDEFLRSDRLDNWKEWQIECQSMPDRIYVNGRLYELVEIAEDK